MVILAFGLLGLVAMQARAITESSASEDRARAAQLADALAAQMWLAKGANLPAAAVSSWKSTVPVSANPTGGLPGGSGSVAYDATHKWSIITLSWTDPHTGQSHSYQTVVQIPGGAS